MFRKRVIAHKGRRVIGLPATNYPPDSPDLLQVPDIYLNDAMKRYVLGAAAPFSFNRRLFCTLKFQYFVMSNVMSL